MILSVLVVLFLLLIGVALPLFNALPLLTALPLFIVLKLTVVRVRKLILSPFGYTISVVLVSFMNLYHCTSSLLMLLFNTQVNTAPSPLHVVISSGSLITVVEILVTFLLDTYMHSYVRTSFYYIYNTVSS